MLPKRPLGFLLEQHQSTVELWQMDSSGACVCAGNRAIASSSGPPKGSLVGLHSSSWHCAVEIKSPSFGVRQPWV